MLSPKVTERLLHICGDLSVSASPSHLPWKGRLSTCARTKAPLCKGSWREAPEGLILADLQLQVVSDGPIFSLAREKIGEKRALLTQKPPSRICSIDGRASAASHLLIREFLPKAHVIVGDG